MRDRSSTHLPASIDSIANKDVHRLVPERSGTTIEVIHHTTWSTASDVHPVPSAAHGHAPPPRRCAVLSASTHRGGNGGTLCRPCTRARRARTCRAGRNCVGGLRTRCCAHAHLQAPGAGHLLLARQAQVARHRGAGAGRPCRHGHDRPLPARAAANPRAATAARAAAQPWGPRDTASAAEALGGAT